jgi:hypothetical protein
MTMQLISSRTLKCGGLWGLAGLATIAATLLSGCGLQGGSSTVAGTGPSSGTIAMTGLVHGGQQAVVGSAIQLYAMGTGGTGTAATPLLPTGASAVISAGNGGFSITGLYTCPSSSSQVYIVATGGSAAGGTNTGIAMAAALGSCGTLQANAASEFIFIDELTTVAAAYSLAPFEGASYTSVGGTGVGPVGLTNAFSAATALVNTTTGNVATAATGVTLPTSEIDTLGDILAACINTSSNTSTQCNTLFTATGATNTLDAAFAIAKKPGAAATTGLYSLASASAPFQPTLSLSGPPNDFTIAVRYTGAELLTPYGIAIDASGNAFVTNEGGFSVTGAPPLSTTFATSSSTAGGGVAGPRGIAIDTNGHFWIANTGRGNVVELAPLSTVGAISNFSSVAYSTIALSGSVADAPVAVTTDKSGNAYFANPNSNNIYAVTAADVASVVNSATLAFPTSITYAPNGDLYIGNAAGQICTTTTALIAPTCVSQNPAQALSAVAYDPGSGSGIGFATTTTGTSMAGAYGPQSGSGPFTGGGLSLPTAIAFDGSGRAFLANTASISEFTAGTAGTAISPATGYGSVSAPAGIAVDPSGNVWTTNSGDNSISIFIGLGSPAVTPLAAVN